MSIRQSDGTFDGKNIVLRATPLDPERPGRKTVAPRILRKMAAAFSSIAISRSMTKGRSGR